MSSTPDATSKGPHDWNKSPKTVTSVEDAPQLEYDERGIQLIADREIDDDDLEYDLDAAPESVLNRGSIKGTISSDGIIDDDFETELGGHDMIEFHSTEDPDYSLMKRISDFGIFDLGGEDKFGRKTIICSACRLPNENIINNSEFKTMDKFFDCLLKYLLRTFDQYVEMDYVIVYFHHGLRSYNRPTYGWLINAYRGLERKYKKNLKALYIVHPTTWIKFLWPVLRSIISAKFSSKLIYINRLGQLTEYVHLDTIKIPAEVKTFDPLIPVEVPPSEFKPTLKFHVPLQFILNHELGEKIPLVIRQTVDYIKNYGVNEPGIFRRSASIALIKLVQQKYNEGYPVVFAHYNDVHLAACVLKIFLRELNEPLLTFRLYPELLGLSHALKRPDPIDVIRDLIIEKLPIENYTILKFLIEFLNLVSVYATTNLMTPTNLSVVFGPILAWSGNVQTNTFANVTLINTFVEILITHFTEIFIK